MYPPPPSRVGCDIRIFVKQSKIGLYSNFSFSQSGCLTVTYWSLTDPSSKDSWSRLLQLCKQENSGSRSSGLKAGRITGIHRGYEIIYTLISTDRTVSRSVSQSNSKEPLYQSRSHPGCHPLGSGPWRKSRRSIKLGSEYGQYSSPPSACIRALHLCLLDKQERVIFS